MCVLLDSNNFRAEADTTFTIRDTRFTIEPFAHEQATSASPFRVSSKRGCRLSDEY